MVFSWSSAHAKARIFWVLLSLFSLLTSYAVVGDSAVKIVQIGDSFASGNGARDEFGRPNNVGPRGCFRSPSNWSQQYAESLAFMEDGTNHSIMYINRACSGAMLKHLTTPQLVRSFTGFCPRGLYPDEYYERNLLQCNHYVKPQIEAIDETVDLVLLTIGANDGIFENMCISCLIPFLRRTRRCQSVLEESLAGLVGMEEPLIQVLADIRRRLTPPNDVMPRGRLVIVGYPHLVTESPYIFSNDQVTINVTQSLRRIADMADTVHIRAMKKANQDAGFEWVTFYNNSKALFKTHEADPDPFRKNPNRWINEMDGLRVLEWYHPNPAGHAALAANLLSAGGMFGATGGAVSNNASAASHEPVAWLGEAVAGRVGQAITFDASASFDPSGNTLERYEWDFDGDGLYEIETSEPIVSHTYDQAFSGHVHVRVWSHQLASGTTSTSVSVNELGFQPQDDDKPCKLDRLRRPILTENDKLAHCTIPNDARYPK